MDRLGRVERVLTTDWSRYLGLLMATSATILVWATLTALGRVTPVVFVVVVIALKALVAARVIPAASRTVELRERGVSIIDLTGRHDLARADLTGYYLGAWPRVLPLGEPPLQRVLRLEIDDELVGLPDDLDGFDDLLAWVGEVIDETVGAAWRAAFEAGEEVACGPVRLHRERGLELADERVDWTGLEVVELTGGRLTIGQEECAAGLLRNPHLLVRLLQSRGVTVIGAEEWLGRPCP